ncbi:MAG: PD40 domain-containing protein, partial [Anaerolineales bacterium]|nr:PD40 domain-containing protein [Anaerolineales bacterium]
TPHYMSPEQADGRSADARSDIYALGIILYELLAGHVPFQGERLEAVIYQHLNEPPPPLGRVRPDLSPHTVELAYRCLEKQPTARYQTAADLLAALDQALIAEGDSKPGALTDTGRQALFSDLLRRSQVLGTLTSTIQERTHLPLWFLGLLLLVLIVVVVLLWPRADVPAVAEASTATATPAAEAAVEPTATVAEVSVFDIPTSTPAPALPTMTPTPTPLPTETPTATPIPETDLVRSPDRIIFQSNRDGDTEIYSMLLDGSNQIQLTHNDAADELPDASPDGTQILFQSDRDGDDDWNVYVMDVDGGNQRPLTDASGNEYHPTWSPDGTQIAFLSDRDGVNNIYIANADGSAVRQVTHSDVDLGNMSWSPDNRLVYNVPGADLSGQELYSVDLNGQNRLRLTDNGVTDWSAEFSRDGRFITFLRPQENRFPAIFVMNADGTGQRQIYAGGNNEYDWGPHWSADNQFIYFTKDIDDVAHLYRVRSDGTGVTFLTMRAAYPSFAVGASVIPASSSYVPDGERIAYQCGDEQDADIYLYNPETDAQVFLLNQPRNSHVPAFSPDGTELSFRSDENGTWQIYASGIDGSNLRQITPVFPNINDTEASWSPEGSQLVIVSAQDDNTRQLYLLNQDGTARTPLTNDPTATFDDPNWSVNDEIVFESNLDGRFKIFVLSPRGGIPRELIGFGDSNSTPAWSPDGEQIAFEAQLNGERHIWIANRDGTDPVQITSEGSDNQRPAWSPDGTQLAFYSNVEQSQPDQFDIWTIDLQTGELTRITSRGNCVNPAWGNVSVQR